MSLRSFQMHGVRLKYVNSIGNLRNSLRKLEVQKSPTESISEVLMCDVIHKTVASENEIWHKITELNLKFNCLDKIDDAIKLVPNVRTLILTGNKITDINNLTHLTKLSHISLAMNCISNLTSLHTKLGNVISIDLSSNSITSLQGFGKLYSLESLDVSMNQISDIEEIKYIGELPCLEYLSLTGNPVAVSVDYRVKVLEHFGQRACEIYLDNEQPTQKEIDTACVLQALRIVKEGKTPNLNQNNFQ